MDVKKVGVVGSGTVGSGIAHVVADGGTPVCLVKLTPGPTKDAVQRVEAFIEAGVKRGKISEEKKKDLLEKIVPTANVDDLSDCDIVVEAVVEDLQAKKSVLARLDEELKPGSLLASTTSSLSITELAASTRRPDRFLGLHFFNPVPMMKLVEVVRGVQTSEATVEEGVAWVRALKKEPVVCKDAPGFIVNRLLFPFLNMAVDAFDRGLASREDIDESAKLGLGHPMGPLTLADLVGLDIHHSIDESLFHELREARMSPPPLLRRMVRAGRLGRKTKGGFYSY